MKKSAFLFFSLLLTFVFACGTWKKEQQDNSNYFSDSVPNELPKGTNEEMEEEKQLPTIRPSYHASRTILSDLIHTKLEVSLDWEKAQLFGLETLTARPHFFPSDSLILDAQGMQIDSVWMNGKKLTYTYANDQLKIKLDATYTANQYYTVQIRYISKPDDRETGGSAAITSDKGLYFINPRGEDSTKMPQIWTQGETQSNSVWFPTVDAPNVKTSFELLLTVADKYKTLSNGNLLKSTKNADGTRTDHWKQVLPHAPYLCMLAVGEFKVVKDFYTRPDGSKIEVNYFVEPEWEGSARAIFGETPKMIRYFSDLLKVEFPWDKYSQIVVRDYVSGAMENTGAVVFGDYAYKNERELLDENDQSTIAHELFHHWFGDLVTAESWSNLTLNESFANYSQYLWDEHRFGLDEAAYQAEQEAEGYFQSAQNSGYHPLVWFEYKDKEQMFDGHSYNKGGRILHMLRCYLGDKAFFTALHNYLTENQFKAAEFNQLRLAFEAVCGEDLNWFFNQWYLGSAHPVLDFSQTNNKDKHAVTIKVKQNQNLELAPIFKLPIQVAVHDSLGKHLHKLVIDQLEQQFELPYTGTLQCVVYDDQQMLLAKIHEEKPLDQFTFQYYHSKAFKTRRDGFMRGTAVQNSQPDQLILDALNDPFWNIRLLAIDRSAKLKEASKPAGLEKIKQLALLDSNSTVRATALEFLLSQLPKQELETILIDRIENDRSYAVVAIALGILGEVNVESALIYAKKQEKEMSSKMQLGLAQLYSKNAGSEAFSFFENALRGSQLKGFDQLGVMNSFTLYCTRLEVADLEKALPIYRYLKDNGDYYTKMFLPQNLSYFQKYFAEKIVQLNLELEAHEKNNDAAYASQVRQKIKQWEELNRKFSELQN